MRSKEILDSTKGKVMVYFPNAKAFMVEPLIGFDCGPGFTVSDPTTMNVERTRYSEAMDATIQRGQRAEIAGNYTNLSRYSESSSFYAPSEDYHPSRRAI